MFKFNSKVLIYAKNEYNAKLIYLTKFTDQFIDEIYRDEKYKYESLTNNVLTYYYKFEISIFAHYILDRCYKLHILNNWFKFLLNFQRGCIGEDERHQYENLHAHIASDAIKKYGHIPNFTDLLHKGDRNYCNLVIANYEFKMKKYLVYFKSNTFIIDKITLPKLLQNTSYKHILRLIHL